jgi:hypothetical protein
MFVDEVDKVAMGAIPYLSVLIKHIEKVNLPNDERVLMQPTNAVRSHVRTARRFRPALECCEERTLMSALPPLAPAIAHPTSPGTYEVINGSLFGPKGPNPLDVHQGYIGDCWLMSALAGTAARNPALITNMFTALGTYREGTATVQLYYVRFHEPSGQVVTELVDNEFPVALGAGLPPGIPADGAVYNDYTTNGVLWAMLAEKAYVQAASSGYVVNDYTWTAHVCADNYANVGLGGDAAWAISAITGPAVWETSTNLSLYATIVMAEPGTTTVLGSDYFPADPNLPGGHAFAVIGYNATTKLFTLDNPWNWTYGGLAYPSEFTCTAAYIAQNFDTIAWN